jgi:hypothetical protein
MSCSCRKAAQSDGPLGSPVVFDQTARKSRKQDAAGIELSLLVFTPRAGRPALLLHYDSAVRSSHPLTRQIGHIAVSSCGDFTVCSDEELLMSGWSGDSLHSLTTLQ